MRLLPRASLGVASLLAAACTGSTEPSVSITALMPAAAYNDTTVALAIEGGPFRPSYEIDTSAGTAVTQLGAFTAFLVGHVPSEQVRPVESLMWLSASQIAVVLPQGLAAGEYDVQVVDPRGLKAVKPNGFTSLGPDLSPPMLSIDEPASRTVVVAQAEVPVAIVADDGAGLLASISWQVSLGGIQMLQDTCPLEPNAHRTTCRFVFVVPEPSSTPQTLTLVVHAEDMAHVANTTTVQTTLSVGIAPTVTSFSPGEAPAAGGTLLTVKGGNFIPGTQVLLGDALLEPNGGTYVDATTIRGTTPAYEPGLVPAYVQTGSSTTKFASSFAFVGQPQVLAVTPSSGPPAGGTPLTVIGRYFRPGGKTRLFMGSDRPSATELVCEFVSANRFECTTPQGSGAATIYAQDPVGGLADLPLAFTYLDVDVADAAASTQDAGEDASASGDSEVGDSEVGGSDAGDNDGGAE